MIFASTMFLLSSILLLFMLLRCSEQVDMYVHMDLKGAPPRPRFFKDSLTVFKKLGAKGVAIEWEDMFPLVGLLSTANHGNAYSTQDVHAILAHAQSIGLEVIPLIQTFGHTEWLAKTPLFANLREDPRYPMVLCIGSDKVVSMLQDLISQVAAIHAQYGMPYFHVGADEAYQVGICPDDVEKLKTMGNDVHRLVFNHLRTLATFIQDEYPDTAVLNWFDEFANVSPDLIREYNLSDSYQPVLWKYWAQNLDQALPDQLWANLSEVFPTVWGASAFKGADGQNKINNGMTTYLKNNKLWRDLLKKHSSKFASIGGVIITGWQRYDHFAALCELLPTSFPALALSMCMLENGTVSDDDLARITTALSCPNGTTLDQLQTNTDQCKFPGFPVRSAIRQLQLIQASYASSTYIKNRENGWFGPTQQQKHFTNPFYADPLKDQYTKILKGLDDVKQRLHDSMDRIYFPETANEFINDNIEGFYKGLKDRINDINLIDVLKTFPVRPVM